MGASTRVLIEVGGSVVRHWIPAYRWIPIAGGFAAFALACAAGANNVASSFAPSVGAGTLTMLQAIVLASAAEFGGTAGVGNLTADARYLNVWKEMPPDAGLLMWGFFVVLIAATVSLGVATYFELPVSSSTSIDGALVGLVLTTRGFQGIYWLKSNDSSLLKVGGVATTILSWILVPIIAAAIGFLFFGFMKIVLLRSQHAEKRTLKALPLYYGMTVVAIMLLLIYKGSPRTFLGQLEVFKVAITASVSGVVAAILAQSIVVPLAQKRLGCFQDGRDKPESSTASTADLLKDEEKKAMELSLQDESMITAEELLRQFVELRVLDTVHEGDEEIGDQTPPHFSFKSSPLRTPGTATRTKTESMSFAQLLAGTPNRILHFKRLHQPKQKMTTRQRLIRAIKRFKAKTVDRKLEYGRETLVRHALAEKFDEKAEELFCFLQILTAMAIAFVQGSNDIAACMAPYAALTQLYKNRKSFQLIAEAGGTSSGSNWVAVAEWMLVLGASGAATGLALWGWKVVRSVGGRFTFVSPSRGFSAQFSLIVALLIATKVGLPTSVVHILLGAMAGVGIADNAKNVNWRLLFIFASGSLITLVASCAVAAGLYSFTIFSPAYSIL